MTFWLHDYMMAASHQPHGKESFSLLLSETETLGRTLARGAISSNSNRAGTVQNPLHFKLVVSSGGPSPGLGFTFSE